MSSLELEAGKLELIREIVNINCIGEPQKIYEGGFE